ncbi:peptidase inhibitor family I36 protein [Streptomyces sp. NPDC047028]|uniref:peptidase inhibitor family I36 protein n=1 Tax=Streptomyces sp. NPDC047028 TaxID=3155793 RepID=UPI0033C1381A
MRMVRMMVATAMVLASGLAAQSARAADRIQLDPAVVFIPPGQTTCQSGFLCLFRDALWRGGGYAIEDGHELNDLGALGFNDEMSSWINATSSTRFCWQPDTNYDGIAHFMDPNTAVGLVLPAENDTASSIQLC